MKLAVAGGTGAVGSHVVRLAQRAGHDVRVLARSTGVDLVAGTGINLDGVDAVIDVSSTSSIATKASVEFFSAVTLNLLRAETEAGVGHHVALSIVGTARAPYGYYAGKLEQERLIKVGSVPWSVLRTTQFYEFAEQVGIALGPIAFIPRILSQPVAASSVAAKLVRIAEGQPLENIVELAGPARIRMVDLLRAIHKARGTQTPVVEFRLPGRLGRALRSGTMLPDAQAEVDPITFAEWLH